MCEIESGGTGEENPINSYGCNVFFIATHFSGFRVEVRERTFGHGRVGCQELSDLLINLRVDLQIKM